MAGKGPNWRTDVDYKKYYTNMDSISGEPIKTKAKKVANKNGKTTYVYK